MTVRDISLMKCRGCRLGTPFFMPFCLTIDNQAIPNIAPQKWGANDSLRGNFPDAMRDDCDARDDRIKLYFLA